MDKVILNPLSMGRPNGYSNGIATRGGRTVYVAGQTGTDATGRIENPFDLIAQYQKTLENIRMIVAEAGGKITDVVRLTVFITDKRSFHAQRDRVDKVFHSYFGLYVPAMTLLEVKSLYDTNAMVEMEAIAVIAE